MLVNTTRRRYYLLETTSLTVHLLPPVMSRTFRLVYAIVIPLLVVQSTFGQTSQCCCDATIPGGGSVDDVCVSGADPAEISLECTGFLLGQLGPGTGRSIEVGGTTCNEPTVGDCSTVCANLPVELLSFRAADAGETVILKWSTAQEVRFAGFEVQKELGGIWSAIGYVPGRGTT
jgi:hypothetical protein